MRERDGLVLDEGVGAIHARAPEPGSLLLSRLIVAMNRRVLEASLGPTLTDPVLCVRFETQRSRDAGGYDGSMQHSGPTRETPAYLKPFDISTGSRVVLYRW